MQKLIYSIWKAKDIDSAAFRAQLLEQLSPALIGLNSRYLRICIADEDVADAAPYIISSDDDLVAGLITLWVDSYIYRDAIEASIAQHVSRYAGYAVWESAPLVEPEAQRPVGRRSPGMCEVVFLRKPDRLSHDEWIAIWHQQHTQVAIDTQSTYGYRQNVVIQGLTSNTIAHDAIIEENFPAEAINSRLGFYAAGNDKALCQAREQAMIDSCSKFIDFERMDCIPMSQYVMQG
tara:strand:+ start:332 stop:1033 length:702 start_codon:yes stop_codon:yes gene_type:complete